MVCHPCQAAGNLSTAAYRNRVAGKGPTYRERLKTQVACGECGEILAAGSLSSCMMTQHGRAAEIRRHWSTPATGIVPETNRIYSLEKRGPQKCPVVG